MKTVLRVISFVLAYGCIMAELLWICSFLPVYSELQSAAQTVSFVFTNLATLSVFLIYRHRTRRESISAEAERWDTFYEVIEGISPIH